MITIALFLSCQLRLIAQDVRKPPDIVSPSPVAASLGQFGSWPVSLYTGVPQIGAPLYTIDLRGFQLPINLSYHASGIKVEDVASWVGTGWALDAGGVITRTAKGLEDDKPNGFYNTSFLNANLPDTFDFVNNDATYKLFGDVANGTADTEPDIFNFNFANVSGQIYFDRTGVARTIPASNILVKHHPMNGSLSSTQKYWEIIDGKGITYILGQDNTSEVTTAMDDDRMFRKIATTAWYLNKIILPNKQDSIVFQYVNKEERYQTKPSQTYRVPGPIVNGLPPIDAEKFGYGYSSQCGEGPYSAINITGGKIKLASINWRYGSVSFFATTPRKDIISGVLLDSIKVFNVRNELQKNLKFNYDNNINRPFLKSIVQKSRNSADTLNLYKFEYYDGLPSRYSNSQDEWGYYNGKTNITLIPNDPFLTEFAANMFADPNADRTVGEESMKAGTIKKIIYPTKGATEFEYEANRFFSIVDSGSTPARDGYYATASANLEARQSDPQKIDSEIVSTASPATGMLISNLKIQIRNYYRGPEEQDSYSPTIKIERKMNGVYQLVDSITAFQNWGQAKTRIKYTQDREDLDFDLGLALGIGEFRITAQMVCKKRSGVCPVFEYQTTMTASFTYQTFIPPIPGSSPGSLYNLAGGLRIKRIANYDTDDKLISEKYYDYTMANAASGGNVVSSGLLLTKPNFFSYAYQPYACTGTQGADCRGDEIPVGIFSSYSMATLGLSQGGYVGYEQVTERDNVNGNNGETVYRYSTAKNKYEPTIISKFYTTKNYRWPIYLPNIDSGYRRGLLLEKTVKAKKGDVYDVVLTEKYEYLFNDYEGAPGYHSSEYVKIMRMADSIGPCCSGLPNEAIRRTGRHKEFAYSFYTMRSPWVQTVSKRITLDGVETVTRYEYGNVRSMQPTKEVIYTSKGDSIVKTYRYPDDMVDKGKDYSGAMVKMVNRNILTPVIEEETAKNTRVLKVRTAYRDWLGNGNLLLPDSVLTSFGTSDPYREELVYNAYDMFGNILSYYAKGTPANFLWGYQSQYPVAKVLGGSYNKLVQQVSSSLLDNPQSDDQLHLELNKLRTGLTGENVQAQSYAYTPLLGITSEVNQQGQKIRYEYDGLGRLKVVRDQYNNVLKVYEYAFGATGEIIYGNDSLSAAFIKKTCSDGYLGEAVIYNVPAGTHTSLISKADANAKAQNDIALNGQLNADLNGKCNKIYYSAEASGTRTTACSSGGEGSTVTYVVPQAKYTSIISQLDANALATSDVAANAQTYANAHGSCTYYNVERRQTFFKNCGADGEGSPVEYVVPARRYPASTQAAADNLAQNDVNANGQNNANAKGFCTYYNSERRQSFNAVCGANYQNIGPVTYVVDARKHSSNISKADADQKAANDIAINGQNYANTYGCVCTGEAYMIINGKCELGRKVQIESHRQGDKWACTYYYQFSNGTRSATYAGLGDQQCVPPINERVAVSPDDKL